LLLLCIPTLAAAQDEKPDRLLFFGLTLRGVHPSLTEHWGTLELTLANPYATGHDARVLVFYSDQPDVQYGRDVWLPGHSMLSTWMLIGPAPEGEARSRELQVLLYDRTGGEQRFALRPGQERIRSRLLPYAQSRTLTSILMDLGPAELGDLDARLNEEGEEILQLVRLFRATCSLPPNLGLVQDNFLLPTADAFDGVDHFILATPRLADDPPGLMALRHWLEQGGKLWVMLDMVEPETLARLLGEDSGFQVVDRTSLTSIRIDPYPAPAGGGERDEPSDEAKAQEFEQPVKFVRVVLSPKYKVLRTVNDWPALCTRAVGRGKLVLTTLSARGWARPRTASDPRTPYPDFPDLPVALPAFDELTLELQPRSESNPFPREALEPLLEDEIGYSIIRVGTAGLIFGIFLAAMLVVGIGLHKSGRSELLAWLGPVAAVAAMAIFLVLGEISRRGVPPTVAVAQLININPRADEQPVTGVFTLFRPDAGPLPVSSTQGGLLDFDMSGLEGQPRQFAMTDLNAWHWENLALPAGVRKGTFRYSARVEKPVSAVATFGPQGLEAKIAPGPFRGLADAVVQSPTQRSLAADLRADSTFTVGDAELLGPGQYLTGAVLTDRQQRRQNIYRQLLQPASAGTKGRAERIPEGSSVLWAWAEPAELPFTFGPGIRTVGSALLVIPLEFEHTPPDAHVTIPRGFVPLRRMLQGIASRPTLEGQYGIEEHLRFQLPPSVLPMQVERARLFAKVNAPLRRFTVAGRGAKTPLISEESPIDPIQRDIVQKDLLQLDEQGGLHFDIGMSEQLKDQEDNPQKWSIEYLELEVIGRTLP
jgi:hypothetical protein